jgi:hypothetical protein
LESASRYGFYGEVIRESENFRWMGPARYDFSGTMVFLKHRWLIVAVGPFLVLSVFFFQLDHRMINSKHVSDLTMQKWLFLRMGILIHLQHQQRMFQVE